MPGQLKLSLLNNFKGINIINKIQKYFSWAEKWAKCTE